MVPFSVIAFGIVVWTIAVSGAKTGPFSFENGLVWTGPKACTFFRVLFLTPIFQVPIFLPQRFNYASNTNGGTDRQKLKQVRPIKGYRYGFLKNC